MAYRGRLLLLALGSVGAAALLGLVAGPLLVGLLHALRIGCTRATDGADTPAGWSCPDGIGYVVPGLVFVAALTGVLFTAGVLLMLRRLTAEGAGPDLRWSVARDLGRLGAFPLVAQAPVSVWAAASSAYSATALRLGVLVGVAGVLPFAAGRARGWAYPVACLLAAGAAGLVVRPAFLLGPAVVGCAGLLLCAAVVSAVAAAGRESRPRQRPGS